MDAADLDKKSSQFVNLRSNTTFIGVVLYVLYGANKHLIKFDLIFLGIVIAAVINLGFIFYLLYLNSTLKDSNYTKHLRRLMVTMVFNLALIYLNYYSYN